jgi:putative transposase
MTYQLSERRACRLVHAYPTTIRYQRRRRPDEPHLRERLRVVAGQRPRWGYRRWHVLLLRERGEMGMSPINRKRIYRLYRLDGLAIRRRPRKRVAVVPRGAPVGTWTRLDTRRGLGHGLYAGCARRWTAVPHAQ